MFSMKKTSVFLCLVVILLTMSCKSTTYAQEETKDTLTQKNVKIEKPKFSAKDIYTKIDPSTIVLIGEFMAIEKSTEQCDMSYEYAISIKVQKVVGMGSGIINKVSSDADLTILLPEKLVSPGNKKSPDLNFKKGDLYRFDLLESLCRDAQKTRYTIMKYEIQ